jgi:hypothetical protein
VTGRGTINEGIGNRTVKPIAKLPRFRTSSPEVVRVLDRIRFRLDDMDTQNSSDEHAEFTWFAREYPRCYRYHLNCADFRLRTISDYYRKVHADLILEFVQNPSAAQMSISDERVCRIYWDFESFLSEINISLDLLARIVGTAYKEEMPPNFNRLCKKDGDLGLLEIMKRAQRRWVRGSRQTTHQSERSRNTRIQVF